MSRMGRAMLVVIVAMVAVFLLDGIFSSVAIGFFFGKKFGWFFLALFFCISFFLLLFILFLLARADDGGGA